MKSVKFKQQKNPHSNYYSSLNRMLRFLFYFNINNKKKLWDRIQKLEFKVDSFREKQQKKHKIKSKRFFYFLSFVHQKLSQN